MASTTTPDGKRPGPTKPERVWSPHIWQGCDFFAWFRLLVRNRFAVHWSCLYIAFIATLVSVFHTLLRFLQEGWYGQQIRRTAIRQPPLFILGHWRTGTTLLHELLILDPRHSYPTTYECMEPNHFLLTEALITRWLGFLMPTRRPMDNMAAGFGASAPAGNRRSTASSSNSPSRIRVGSSSNRRPTRAASRFCWRCSPRLASCISSAILTSSFRPR